MRDSFNYKLILEVHNLIKEAKENFLVYVSDGFLNTEGKKIKILIIRKYARAFNDKKYFSYLRKNKEEDFLRMLRCIEEEILNYLPTSK